MSRARAASMTRGDIPKFGTCSSSHCLRRSPFQSLSRRLEGLKQSSVVWKYAALLRLLTRAAVWTARVFSFPSVMILPQDFNVGAR